MSFFPAVVSTKDREESLRLSLSEFHEISPSAKFVPDIQILSSADKLADFYDSMILRLCDLLLP